MFDVASSNESGNFMLFVKNNKLHLRESHPTYYQIQCQLALTGSNFCDLIVYTFRSIAIIRVTFDAQFWAKIIDIIGPRFFQNILPKLELN